MPWADVVRATIQAWLPGEAFGEALAEAVAGDVEPGGRVPASNFKPSHRVMEVTVRLRNVGTRLGREIVQGIRAELVPGAVVETEKP